MRFLPLVVLLFAVPAFAQQPAQYQSTSEVLLQQALKCEQIATGQYQQLSRQVADLTKERDALKVAKDEAPKP